MPRFGYADSFSSQRSVEECVLAARDALTSVGCKSVVNRGEKEVAGKIGMGWAIRLLGGLMTPPNWFPVSVWVSVIDAGDRRDVQVHADENFGPGSLLGIEQKVRARCNDLGVQINQSLKSRLNP